MTAAIYNFNTAARAVAPASPQEHERDLDALRAELRRRVRDVVRDLYPNAIYKGTEARIGDVNGEPGGSTSIELEGERAGLWTDHAKPGVGGDLFDLWCVSQGLDTKGADFVKAADDLRLYLGMTPGAKWLGSVARVAAERAKAPKVAPPTEVSRQTYVYTSADGQTVLAQVIRRAMSNDTKTFYQRNAAGEPKAPEVRPLYNLPGIVGEAVVVLVEGEKCADALKALGIPATTLMGGSNAPLAKSDLTPLAGKVVATWADNDDTGKGFMTLVGAQLRDMGCDVRPVAIPADARPKWDAFDAIAEGRDVSAMIGAAVAVDALCVAPAFEPRSFDGVLPPPRRWAYGTILMSTAATAIASPPGTGKTTFSVQVGISFGLDLPFGPWRPVRGGGGKVWLYNGEEPIEELDRRFIASCKEAKVEPAVAAQRFFYNSGLNERLTFVRQDPRSGELVRSPDVDAIKEAIIKHGFKLFIIDPLIEFHGAKEDTEGFHAVGAVLREIANDCDCAVLFFHHTPKSANSDTAAGDMNSMRGGGPIVGVARFVATMFGMSEKDAVKYSVPPADRNRYVRFDDAKANMAVVSGEPQWWVKVGIDIDNADDIRAADNIGVLRFMDLGKPDEERGRRRAASADVTLAKIAQEMARVCLANGHTGADSAAPFDALIRALDRAQTEVSPNTAKDIVTSKMGSGMKVSGGQIVITTTQRGQATLRRVHFDGAAT